LLFIEVSSLNHTHGSDFQEPPRSWLVRAAPIVMKNADASLEYAVLASHATPDSRSRQLESTGCPNQERNGE
jgi:hypothetical protein